MIATDPTARVRALPGFVSLTRTDLDARALRNVTPFYSGAVCLRLRDGDGHLRTFLGHTEHAVCADALLALLAYEQEG